MDVGTSTRRREENWNEQAKNSLQSRSGWHGLSWTIRDCQILSWTVIDCHRKNPHFLSFFLKTSLREMINKPEMAYSRDLADMDYHGLSWAVMDCHGLPQTVMDCHGLSWIIDYRIDYRIDQHMENFICWLIPNK